MNPVDEVRSEYIDIEQSNNQPMIIRGVFQYDHGLKLRIYGLPADAEWQIHYGYSEYKDGLSVIGQLEGEAVVAAIPDILLMQAKPLWCYVYYEEESVGLTVYEIQIPIIPRIKPAAGTYTPEQIDNYDILLSEQNNVINSFNQANFYVNPTDGCQYMVREMSNNE